MQINFAAPNKRPNIHLAISFLIQSVWLNKEENGDGDKKMASEKQMEQMNVVVIKFMVSCTVKLTNYLLLNNYNKLICLK